MKKITVFTFILICFSFFKLEANSDTSKCIWKSAISNFYTWDTCQGNGGKNSLNAYLALKGKTCLKYAWSINGVALSTNNYFFNKKITANGNYAICVKVTDTCNKCDTTLCYTRTISCFSSCNWKAKSVVLYTFDTCVNNSSSNSINGYLAISSRSCLKYVWSVNGSVVSGSNYYLNYPISKNGTYNLCVKVIDTCNKCDTTLCSVRTISCYSGGSNTCNFKARTPYFFAWDTCKGNAGANSVNAYISFQSFYCLKYQWSVNGVTQSSKTFVMNYPVKANGTYVVCVKVIDSCGNCDTTICSTRTISCFSNCNWKSKSPNITSFDTCKGNGARNSMNAYLAINNRSCLKYQWSVNGVTQSTKNYYINYPITKNGTYVLCIKVTDTCNKCDTTLCTTRTFTCFSNCNWKANTPYFYAWDSCLGTGHSNSLNAYISMKNSNCNKYSWTINGVAAGNTNILNHHITQNGIYNVCVKVTDTCKKCDTTFCSTRSITCFSSCDFKARTPYFSVWDSCVGSKSSINGYITFYNRNCMKYAWTLDSQAIGKGDRLINIPITKNGTHTLCVKVTDTCNHCDTTFCMSRTINCNGLGFNQIASLLTVEIYPNPANEMVIINTEKINLENATMIYTITDVVGNQINSGRLTLGQNSIPTSTWSNGIYWINIISNKGDAVYKIIVNH